MSAFGKVTLGDIGLQLRNILILVARPLWMNPATGGVRLVDTVTTVTTVSTVTAVTSVTSLTQINGITASDAMIVVPLRSQYFQNVRPRIT